MAENTCLRFDLFCQFDNPSMMRKNQNLRAGGKLGKDL
jgi:hypothetical protein